MVDGMVVVGIRELLPRLRMTGPHMQPEDVVEDQLAQADCLV